MHCAGLNQNCRASSARGVAIVLALVPQLAWAHSGPPPEIFLSLLPVGACVIATALWMRKQTKLPKLAALAIAVGLVVAVASAAFFLPGLLPVGNQNYGVASVAVNAALTLGIVAVSVPIFHKR